jgi:hypothetical protein
MHPSGVIEVPKFVLQVLNNLCDIERKLLIHGDPGNAKRNVERIKEAFEDERVFFEDPMGQAFTETRTDLEATITGEGTDNLKVVEVIKPIVRVGDKNFSRVVQKGIVIVQTEVGEK